MVGDEVFLVDFEQLDFAVAVDGVEVELVVIGRWWGFVVVLLLKILGKERVLDKIGFREA